MLLLHPISAPSTPFSSQADYTTVFFKDPSAASGGTDTPGRTGSAQKRRTKLKGTWRLSGPLCSPPRSLLPVVPTGKLRPEKKGTGLRSHREPRGCAFHLSVALLSMSTAERRFQGTLGEGNCWFRNKRRFPDTHTTTDTLGIVFHCYTPHARQKEQWEESQARPSLEVGLFSLAVAPSS